MKFPFQFSSCSKAATLFSLVKEEKRVVEILITREGGPK
jgi:sulfopyruvate decarboxylase TPP-binding subunit